MGFCAAVFSRQAWAILGLRLLVLPLIFLAGPSVGLSLPLAVDTAVLDPPGTFSTCSFSFRSLIRFSFSFGIFLHNTRKRLSGWSKPTPLTQLPPALPLGGARMASQPARSFPASITGGGRPCAFLVDKLGLSW